MRHDKPARDKKKQPAIMGRPDKEGDKQEVSVERPDPRPLLKKALARHDLHASGAELADEYSNTKLREDLQAALDALDAERKEDGSEETGETAGEA